jgi:hypothetical protein
MFKKGIHSHNDYWRDVPLFSALSYGVTSVEADVWLINGTLYVGHELEALTTDRTFDGLYIQPLVQILEHANPDTPFTNLANRSPSYYLLSNVLISAEYLIGTVRRLFFYLWMLKRMDLPLGLQLSMH